MEQTHIAEEQVVTELVAKEIPRSRCWCSCDVDKAVLSVLVTSGAPRFPEPRLVQSIISTAAIPRCPKIVKLVAGLPWRFCEFLQQRNSPYHKEMLDVLMGA